MKRKSTLSILALVATLLVGCKGDKKPSSSEGDTTIDQKADVEGLKFLYMHYSDDQQYDWEQYGLEESYVEYGYLDYQESSKYGIELGNPDLFAEQSNGRAFKEKRNIKKAESSSNGLSEYVNSGISKSEFFELASTLVEDDSTHESAASGATGLKQVYSEAIGYEYWAISNGYDNYDQSVEYSIYDNDIVIVDIETDENKVTDFVYTQQGYVYDTELVHKESTEQMFMKTIDNSLYFVEIMDTKAPDGQTKEKDEYGKYPTPDNYRELIEVSRKDLKITDVIKLGMNSSLAGAFTEDNYESAGWADAVTRRVFEGKIEDNGNKKLLVTEKIDFTGRYSGQGVIIEYGVTFNTAGKLVSYDYNYASTYYTEMLEIVGVEVTMDYESKGNYDGTIFDYNDYHDLGTLLPTLEAGALDNQAEDILDSIYDYKMEDKVNIPTTSVEEYYNYSNYANENYPEDEQVEMETYSTYNNTLYADNVIVSDYHYEYYHEYESAIVDDAIVQTFVKDDTVYQLVDFYEQDDYKVTAKWNGLDFSLINYDFVDEMVSAIAQAKKNGYLFKLSADLIPGATDEYGNYIQEHYVVSFQVAKQQASNVVGHLVTYELAFAIIDSAN